MQVDSDGDVSMRSDLSVHQGDPMCDSRAFSDGIQEWNFGVTEKQDLAKLDPTLEKFRINGERLGGLDNLSSFEKVNTFIIDNPLNPAFIKKEKGRLPYSVFKPHAEVTFFLKSIFDKRPPTAFFPYPKYTKTKRNSDRLRQYKQDEVEYLFMAFKINDNTHIYNAVVNSFKGAGFNMVENNSYWNVMWSGKISHEDL